MAEKFRRKIGIRNNWRDKKSIYRGTLNLAQSQLKRAGLDYHDLATVTVHEDWAACCNSFVGRRIFAVSTKGSQRYDLNIYKEGDVFLFGRETGGLPTDILKLFENEKRIRLPMAANNRSMNLSNAVAVVVFEAWRQTGFLGAG